MINKVFGRKINIYFFFIALALTVSAYFLLLDNLGGYVSKINILVTPQNTKTAVYLSELKEGVVVIAQKNNVLDEGVVLNSNPQDNLIEIQSRGKSREKANELLNSSTKKFLNLFSKFYDIKNDLNLEIVSKETTKERANKFFILLLSIIIGIVLSFVVQWILILTERIILTLSRKRAISKKESAQTEKYLGDFFKTNREKIQKLSSSFPMEVDIKKKIKDDNDIKNKFEEKPREKSAEDSSYVYFKKAASPANLPIAQEDLNKIVQIEKEEIKNEEEILNELGIFAASEIPGLPIENTDKKVDANFQPETKVDADSLKDALKEPTEEDFKKRLNQLLGNK